MTPRRRNALVVLAVLSSMGAAHRTPNFVVHAPTPEIAERVGQWAEHYRKQKAMEWLGREMPNWPAPCPLQVKVNMSAPGGATHFTFGPQGVTSQQMEIEGPLDRLIYSVLPHEITHTVFAAYFRSPVPRWADEGGSVLSEDDIELENHNKLVRKIMNSGKQFPLRRLFSLRDYPPQREQVMCLYAQGFSVAHYLVHRSDKQTYLKFVAHGMRHGWDGAAQTYYRHKSVEELEQAWIQHMRDTKGMTVIQIAQAKNKSPGQQPVEGTQVALGQPTGGQTVVRTTAPPAQPLEPTPIYRGSMPEQGDQGQRFGGSPGYLPQPAPQQHPQVQLGRPQMGPPPSGPPAIPAPVSPAGFPQ